MAIAIFRVDEQEWMYNEIREGRLRQGWGAPEFSLLKDGHQVPKKEWETTYEQKSGEPPSPRRYSILCGMLQLSAEKVDMVVAPKMPHPLQLTIARVREGYQFDFDGNRLPPDFLGDYRHIIDIDPDSVRTFHYQANDDSFLVSGLFSRACHRAAVSFNHDPEHRQEIRTDPTRTSEVLEWTEIRGFCSAGFQGAGLQRRGGPSPVRWSRGRL